ncbi:MAG: alpha/beta hydrolase [Turicibacter sanguinis]
MVFRLMKNTFIVVTIILLLIVVFLIIAMFIGSRPIKSNYYNQVDAVGMIEKKYTNRGEYEVESIKANSNEELFKEYKIWYPLELEEKADKTYPVVLLVNGTGVPYTKYGAIFEHLASWGFIVVGNDDKNSASGKSSSIMLNYILSLNEDNESIFFGKIDLGNIGISGHSQGGVGAINAVTSFDNSNIFTSLYTASTTALELAQALEWDYDVSKIKIPYFKVAATGKSDAELIAPLLSLIDNYNRVESEQLTIMGRRKNVEHDQMLTHADGYMTAWFRYTLMNDEEAGQAFSGDVPEILTNLDNWQDVQIKE